MTTRKLALWMGLLALGLASTAQATPTLDSRLGGKAYYDPTTNLTWLANANVKGRLSWSDAMNWATNLSIDGVTGWRLPTSDASCGSAYNCTGSEMGHLYYTEFGGTPLSPPSAWSPFSNVQPDRYWSSTQYAPDTTSAWDFGFDAGLQDYDNKILPLYAWAVHAGDVAAGVPEPGTVWLMGAGLVGLLGISRRKRRA